MSTSDKNKKGVTPNKEVKLDIQKVTIGIPNTVLFRYDIGSTIADTSELQQPWDERKPVVLAPSDSLVTSTYFTQVTLMPS